MTQEELDNAQQLLDAAAAVEALRRRPVNELVNRILELEDKCDVLAAAHAEDRQRLLDKNTTLRQSNTDLVQANANLTEQYMAAFRSRLQDEIPPEDARLGQAYPSDADFIIRELRKQSQALANLRASITELSRTIASPMPATPRALLEAALASLDSDC